MGNEYNNLPFYRSNSLSISFGSAPRGDLGFLHALHWIDSILLEENIPENVAFEQNNKIDVCIIYYLLNYL